MAGFQLRKAHSMAKGDLRSAAERLARELENAHGVHARWEGDSVRIRGSGVDGKLTLGESEVLVSVELGLLASPFKGVLRSEVQRFLDEYVA
ncbi:MAG: polyhydroxyalkanoic acid system family protein [Halieaceae bacterium]|jgi:putative polyhydroxyalkanoate system protein|nr:polyhydroxyalkanoic acid system family protein [Halieaceae bacterium]